MANTVVSSTANTNMIDRPLYLQAKSGDAAISYAGSDFRYLIEATFPAEGVVGASSFAVTQNGAGDGTVNVSAGSAVIDGDGAANLGAYLVKSGGTVNLTVPAAPTSTTRVDRVIIRVRDSQLDSSTTYDWTLEILEDTGTGTPAQPNSAVTLALITRVGSNPVLTAAIADQRTRADLDPARAWGTIGGKEYASTGAVITNSDGYGGAHQGGGAVTYHYNDVQVMDTGPVTTIAGRRYRVSAQCWYYCKKLAGNGPGYATDSDSFDCATDFFYITDQGLVQRGGTFEASTDLAYTMAQSTGMDFWHDGHNYGPGPILIQLSGEYNEAAGASRTFIFGMKPVWWSINHDLIAFRGAGTRDKAFIKVEDIGPSTSLTAVA